MRSVPFLMLLALSIGADAQDDTTVTYGKNVISFAPMLLHGSGDFGGAAFGLAYECLLGRQVSIAAPVLFDVKDPVVQIAVGPKFYPTGHEGAVKYSVAPMALYTTSGRILEIRGEQTHLLGLMMVHAVNVTIDGGLVLTTEGGIGVNYFDDRYNYASFDIITQLRFNLGYRF